MKENTKKMIDIKAEEIIRQAVRLPIVRVNREKFLRKELIKYYPETVVDLAIEKTRLMLEFIKRKLMRFQNK